MAVSVRAQLDPTIAAWLLDPAHPTVRRLARTRLGLADEGPSPVPLGRRAVDPGAGLPAGPRRSTRTTSGRACTGGWGRSRSSTRIPRTRPSRPSWSRRSRGWPTGSRRRDGSPARSRCAAGRGSAGPRRASRRGRRRGSGSRTTRAWRARSSDCSGGSGPTAAGTATSDPRRATPRSTSRGARCGRWPGSETRIRRPSSGATRARARTVRPSSSSRTGWTGATRPASSPIPNIDGMRWPPYWHYDRLVGLRMLHAAGHLADPRTAGAARGPAGRAATRRHVARGQALLEAAALELRDLSRGGRLDARRRAQDAHPPGPGGPRRGRLRVPHRVSRGRPARASGMSSNDHHS